MFIILLILILVFRKSLIQRPLSNLLVKELVEEIEVKKEEKARRREEREEDDDDYHEHI
jgi:hypothetical protein